MNHYSLSLLTGPQRYGSHVPRHERPDSQDLGRAAFTLDGFRPDDAQVGRAALYAPQAPIQQSDLQEPQEGLRQDAAGVRTGSESKPQCRQQLRRAGLGATGNSLDDVLAKAI